MVFLLFGSPPNHASINVPRVVTKETQENIKETSLSLQLSLDIIRANTRPRSRNWNNICGDNILLFLRDIS